MDERYDNVENLISPESIQALQNAFLTMQNALKSFSEAVNEALVNAENENHETVTKLLEAYQTAREVKKREYDVEKLKNEIDKQPVININRTHKKVKLPQHLIKGWRQ